MQVMLPRRAAVPARRRTAPVAWRMRRERAGGCSGSGTSLFTRDSAVCVCVWGGGGGGSRCLFGTLICAVAADKCRESYGLQVVAQV